MSKAITGVHHIALKPTAAQYEKTIVFYTEILGMEVVRSWGNPEHPNVMISCGDNTCMEILCGEEEAPRGGALAHVAFATEQVDGLIEKIREAGYEIAKEPTELELDGNPCRIAFCFGPTGEYLEFFWEK